jgi:restriction system protein
MAIPDFQAVMLPLLEAVSDGQEHLMRHLVRSLADRFGLTDEERKQMQLSGEQTLFSNRVHWAKLHLKMAGLLENPTRGYIRISATGREVLMQGLDRIDLRFLKEYPSYQNFIKKSEPAGEVSETVNEQSKTPKELIDAAYKALRSALAEELLERVKAASPQFFEETVVKLLVAILLSAHLVRIISELPSS